MRYQKTHSDDIPELTRLWKQAFGDSDEDIARFFRDLFPAATGFAARDGEKIAAMCFALPQQLSCGDTVLSAAYLYAVATDEGYRGQGLCRALLAFAEKELKKRGADAVLLVPADEGLAAMYERLGYRGPARIRKPSEAKEALGAAESLRKNYQKELCLTDLLAEAHMSKSYFLRLFRRYMGTTPYNYLINFRITQAKELLVLTDHSISAIAREVGFGDASNFSTRFANATGQSPLQYRKSALKSGKPE